MNGEYPTPFYSSNQCSLNNIKISGTDMTDVGKQSNPFNPYS